MSNRTLSNLEQQTIALAGVAQAARLVDQISETGSYPLEFLESSVRSLFVFDMQHAEEIYDGLPGVRLGLQNLCALLANQKETEQRDAARYFFNILHLGGFLVLPFKGGRYGISGVARTVPIATR